MTFDSRQAQSFVLAFPVVHQIPARIKFRSRAFPDAPRARRIKLRLLVVARQTFVIRAHKIAAFFERNRLAVAFPEIWENLARAVLIKPQKLFPARQKNAAQNQAQTSVGMRFRVGETKRAAPRTTEDK